MIYVVNNLNNYHMNSSIHRIDTWYKNQLHKPVAKLSCFQKRVFYSGIKIFNSLPCATPEGKNKKSEFKASLRRFLVAKSLLFTCKIFYTQSKLTCNIYIHFST